MTVYDLDAYKFEELVARHLLGVEPDDVPEVGLIRDAAAGVGDTTDECLGRVYPRVRADMVDNGELADLVEIMRDGEAPVVIVSGCGHGCGASTHLAIHTLLSALVNRDVLPAGDYIISYEP